MKFNEEQDHKYAETSSQFIYLDKTHGSAATKLYIT